MTLRRNLSVFLVPLALGFSLRPAHACMNVEPTLFVAPYDPDAEPARFAAGELGVLQPTWIRAYLVVAYRHLVGLPLSDAEQSAVVAYFGGPKPHEHGGFDAWRSARAAAAGPPAPPIVPERSVDYSSYVNCGDDAFRRAAATLDAYARRFGRTAPETTAWREAQDRVFENCGGSEARIPEPLPSGAALAFRRDRAYQVASANFYAGRLEDARGGFEAIAKDSGSPWRTTAPYLAARAVLRRATLAERPDPAVLADARARFAALVSGSPSSDVRRWSADLVRFVDLRLEPASLLAAAAAQILSPTHTDDFGPAFVHYRDLLFRVLGWGPDPGAYVPDPKDDLTSWIVAFQDDSPRGLERALAGFSRAHTAPWTLAVLSKIDASHVRAAEVVEAARPLAVAGPGRLHAAYHLARLATEAGRTDEARKLVEANLAHAEGLAPSAKNLFLGLKLRNAVTFEEFASAAPRSVVGAESDRNFDEYTRDVLNRRLPLDALVLFAEKTPLPKKGAADVRSVVFTRAVLLGRTDVARRFAPPAGEKIAWDRPDWRLDATLAILFEDFKSRPYFVLDPPFSIAWWCALPGIVESGRAPAFLSDAERRAAAEEVARLAAEPPAATWFCRQALEFAKASPDDPRVPRLVARAVRATREGCGDGETRARSKAAFQLLHTRYPNSPWAKETKYWFEGRGWPPWPPPEPPSPAPPPS